jgi:hypothetical protein
MAHVPPPTGAVAGALLLLDETELALLVGLVADGDWSGEAVDLAQPALQAALMDLRRRYPATPILAVECMPETFARVVNEIGTRVGARVIDLAAPGLPVCAAGDARNVSLGSGQDTADSGIAAFLAEHCHFVIAVSNSLAKTKTRLVEQIAEFRAQGLPERYKPTSSVLDRNGLGSLYHIVVEADAGPAAGQLQKCVLMEPTVETPLGPRRINEAAIWDHVEAFNRDAASLGHGNYPASQRAPAKAGCADDLLWIADRYSVADRLALRFQRLTHRTALAILVLSVVAIVCFHLSFHFPAATYAYLVAIVVAFVWYRWAQAKRYEQRYYDCRALAEGLRVQMHWRAAGIGACVADCYLQRQRSELDWIRHTLRSCKIVGRASPSESSQGDLLGRDRLRRALDEWVEDQRAFYARKALRSHLADKCLSRTKWGLFSLGMLLAGAKTLVLSGHWLTEVIAAAVVMALLFHVFSRTRAFAEHASQYQRMSQLFGDAKSRLREFLDCDDAACCRQLLLELGKEALTEHGDWLLLHRERPIGFHSAPTWLSWGFWLGRWYLRSIQGPRRKASLWLDPEDYAQRP